MRTLIYNISKIYTPDAASAYGTINCLESKNIIMENGLIGQICPSGEESGYFDNMIDAGGGIILPGFVDAHTHPVFCNTREDEFFMRVQGKSYEEIARQGGGIRNSVRKFRGTSTEAILEQTLIRIKRFAEFGVTTLEAKSGYGLSLQDEIRSLEIIAETGRRQPLELIPTFLGAHEVPDEYQENRAAYIDLVINEMLPRVAESGLAEYCDVFCENGVFTVAESRKILQAAKALGLGLRIHADELSAFGGAELAGELGAITADHLIKISEDGIRSLAENKVIPVMLPGTTFFLGKKEYAPARKLLEAGCQIAIATDYNPGSSFTQNIQLMWTIAALQMGLTAEELLWATTLIPARSLGRDHQIGSIHPGKQADLIILDAPGLNYVPYHYGVNHVSKTIKKGVVIYER